MAKRLVLTVLGFALCGSASAAVAPGTSWLTTTQVENQFRSQPLTLSYCPQSFGGAACVLANGLSSGYTNVQVHVVSVAARGIGVVKTDGNLSTYQSFDVRVCAVDYAQGGAKVSAHMLWQPGQPAASAAEKAKQLWAFRKMKSLIASGASSATVAQQAKALAPYLKNVGKAQAGPTPPTMEDWAHRGYGPLMHEGCSR